MVAILKISSGLVLWTAVLSCFLPRIVFFPCDVLQELLTPRGRRFLLAFWYTLQSFAGICGFVCILALWAHVMIAAEYNVPSFHDLMHDPDVAKRLFLNGPLIGLISALLFALLVRVFADRCVAIACNAKACGIGTRLLRTLEASALWWLVSEQSVLCVPMALALSVHWSTMRTHGILILCGAPQEHKHTAKTLHIWSALFFFAASAHSAGVVYSSGLHDLKRHSSLVVLLSIARVWSLGREALIHHLHLKTD